MTEEVGLYHAPTRTINIISWNYRGVAGAFTVQELMDLCKWFHYAVLFLIETRTQRGRMEELERD